MIYMGMKSVMSLSLLLLLDSALAAHPVEFRSTPERESCEATFSASIDPLTTRWTFGAHEPYSMYRRMGKRSTGGLEGSAVWLRNWFDWWDVKAPETMQKIGLNALHARFYKGMGWAEEKKDFPNVKRFVANCHANGVTALAYVQFSTIYHEPMSVEVENLSDWIQVDEHGEKRLWNGVYFRWMPCVTCEAWQSYIEKILAIALDEGDFDGIMFDNVFVAPCYCSRCERMFSEHIAALPDCAERFGFSSVRGIRQPRPTSRTDVKDPVYQEWLRWRVESVNRVMARFRHKIKSLKASAIVAANAEPFRGANNAAEYSIEMVSLGEQLDLFMMQSDNFPGFDKKTGVVSNRVRDLKLAAELGKPIVALCDANVGQGKIDESVYLRPLVEDLIWKGIPTDRTVMSPVRTPGFIDHERFNTRALKLKELNELANRHRAELSAPSYCPVRILYPATALMFSKMAHIGITGAEEALLRNHVPYGYLIVKGAAAPVFPEDCEVLVVANQEWLSDVQVEAVGEFAKRGGRVVVTGESGLWDEHGAQRFSNPLREVLSGCDTVVWREKPVKVTGELGWRYRIEPPEDGGKWLMDDFSRIGWNQKIKVSGIPPFVFLEVKRLSEGYAVMFLNYNSTERVCEGRIETTEASLRIPEFELYHFLSTR